jgi:hypothetical protein
MRKLNKKVLIVLACLGLAFLLRPTARIYSQDRVNPPGGVGIPLTIFMAHPGSSPGLERPPALFAHDRHTTALKQGKEQDCGVCHLLKQTDSRLSSPEVKVFKFPMESFDRSDKDATMKAYHAACVGCHRKMAGEGKKTGPDVGLCGNCHVKKPRVSQIAWAWAPLFNYARHNKHVDVTRQSRLIAQLNVASKVETVGEITAENKTCLVCHHTYEEKPKKLVYKKDTENSCRACHKASDEKNARSMRQAAHAACIGCHMKLAEEASRQPASQPAAGTADQAKKPFGPFECWGCHGVHKELAPEEIVKIPRLVRGQKDLMDLSLAAAEEAGAPGVKAGQPARVSPVRMKVVPFNHKAHEPRAEFCNACHHHSLEKCINCHTPVGADNKGGGVSYERVFHSVGSKQSCVGCHSVAKQDKKCAGCHQWMPNGMASSSCAVCHRGPSDGKVPDVAPAPLFIDKEKVPEKLRIKALEKEFKPAEIPHLQIVNKLVTICNQSSLARLFHAAKEQALCSGCHHGSELQQAAVKAPKCSTCHNRSFAPDALSRPGLLAAYHRQCMGCHQAMKQKPAALECVKCHQAKDGVQTAGLIPPVAETRR